MFNKKNKLTFSLLIIMIFSLLLLAFSKSNNSTTEIIDNNIKDSSIISEPIRDITERKGRF